MKMVTLSLVAAMAIGLLAVSPTPVPTQKTDFSSMSFYLGTWACHQMLRGKVRPDTFVTTMGGGGAYMVQQDSAPPFDAYRNFTVKTTSYITYDPTIKKWVEVGIDNGGGYSLVSSPGWRGNMITWTATTLDGSRGTDVQTKVSNTLTVDHIVGTDAQGHVLKQTTTCKKTSA